MCSAPSYEAVDAALARLESLMSGAEAHGTLAGMLCSERPIDIELWLGEVLAETERISVLGGTERSLLEALFDETVRVLDEADFTFDLFLPDDAVPLNKRSHALSEWCRGFLFGLGYARRDEAWPEFCHEALQDLSKISRLDPHASGEDDEVAYMELCEYVRVAMQMLHDDIRSGRKQQSVH